MKPRSNSPTIIFRNDQKMPLGHLSLAGHLYHAGRQNFKTMRVLGSYALVYLIEGSGSYHDANGISQRVAAGDLLVLFPEIAHRYGAHRGENWREIYVVFEGPVFDLWRAEGVLSTQQPILHLEPVDEWLERFVEVLTPIAGQSPQAALTNLTAFLNLLTAICAQHRESYDASEEKWLALARSRLDENLSVPLDMREVAREAGLSYESFRKRFAHETGTPPARYRTERRIAAAQTLLLQTNFTLRAVANHLGFSDEFHFSRRFKEVTGVTPRAWRVGGSSLSAPERNLSFASKKRGRSRTDAV